MMIDQVVQIAGVRSTQEAEMLVRAGVKWLGFPLRLDYHRPDVTDEEAARIIRALPPDCLGVLITYQQDAGDILKLAEETGSKAVQLHGDISPDEMQLIKDRRPDLILVKSLIVGKESVAWLEERIRATAELVDGYITDTFDPETGASGATGIPHDWSISRRLVKVSPVPVILAGGLTPANVRRAIIQVGPAGVDAHTGVEDRSGGKSPALVAHFISEARAGFRLIAGVGNLPEQAF